MKKVLALDVGGTKTRVALINEELKILRCRIVFSLGSDKKAFLRHLDQTIEDLHINMNEIEAIGLGVPGVVKKRSGHVLVLPNLHLKDIPLGSHLRKTFGKDVFIRNDAEAACLAEALAGVGKTKKRVFFITISTGLGGALCVNGRISDHVTEIGHTAVFHDGEWSEYEKLASGTGLVSLAKRHGLDVRDASEFFALLGAKDERAMKIYKIWRELMHSFITLIKNSYRPDVIVLTGGVLRSRRYFLNDLKKDNPDVTLRLCHHKEKAGLIGAALLAFEGLKSKRRRSD